MTNTSVLQFKAYKRAFQLFDDLLAGGHQGVASPVKLSVVVGVAVGRAP